MNTSALSLMAGIHWLAVMAAAYDLNEIEQNAVGCIQHSYEVGGSKEGKFQITCRDTSVKATFKNIWISTAMAGAWDRLPWFKEGGACKSKSTDPNFLKGSIECAKKLLAAHCGTETKETAAGNNIKALIEAVTPKANVCRPLYALTDLEKKGLEFIRDSVAALQEGTRRVAHVQVSCSSEMKLESLKISFVRTEGDKVLKLKANLLDLVKGQRVLECATRMLEQRCGNRASESTDNSVYTNLVDMVRPMEKAVCE